MLIVEPDRIDPRALAVLRDVTRVTNGLGLRSFVAGAMARDILLTGVFGLSTGRRTRDVDIAVAVRGWSEFEGLEECLLRTGTFEKAATAIHRFHHRSATGEPTYPLDLIPFGGVEQEGSRIAWPPDMTVLMSVAGYEDALGTALEVALEPGLTVRVASLPGLAVLKIFTWEVRGAADPKDAIDLVTLFRQYVDAGNEDRLYGAELHVLESVDYDPALAGPRLLGQDVRLASSAATISRLEALFSQERMLERLTIDMARESRYVEDSLAEAGRLLEQFRIGLRGDRAP